MKTLREDVLRYAKGKYKTEPEPLWRRFPHYAVLRHEDNRKWYGLIMEVPRENLGLHGEGRVDILNVKLADTAYADMLIHQNGYFKGYHISRGNWVSVLLRIYRVFWLKATPSHQRSIGNKRSVHRKSGSSQQIPSITM